MILTTHVLDTARGVPAAGIGIVLFAVAGGARTRVSAATTNADGRTDAPLANDLAPGDYELTFAVDAYFAALGQPAFFTEIPVRFRLAPGVGRWHVPLLLSPWGYTTYRGS